MENFSHSKFFKAQSRLLARLRSEYPLLIFLPGFVTGQLAAWFFNWHILTLEAFLFLLYFIFIQSGSFIKGGALLKMALCGFVPGSLSMLTIFSSSEEIQLESDKPYLVRAGDSLRHPKPGVAQVGLEVIAERMPKAEDGWRKLPKPVFVSARMIQLPWRNSSKVTQGSVFVMKARVSPLRKGLNPFSFESTLRRHGYTYTAKLRYLSRPLEDKKSWVERVQNLLIGKTEAVLGNHERAGLVLSMSIGRRDMLSDETERAFKRTGLAHLLVLSGYQVTLFYYTIFQLLKWFSTKFHALCLLLPLNTACAALALLFSAVLVILSGIEGASMRAILALLFAAAASMSERSSGMGNAILVSLLFLSLIWPGAYLEPGVQLTYAALYGILLGLSAGAENGISGYIKICFCASLCTTLVVVIWFGNLPLLSPVLNLLLAPVLNLIGCQGSLLALTLYLTGLDYQGYLLKAVSFLLCRFCDLIWFISNAPICIEELTPIAVATWAIILALGIFEISRRRLKQYKLLRNL